MAITRSVSVRYFHWALVVAVLFAFLTGYSQMGPHPLVGIFILMLVLWRWFLGVWGAPSDRWHVRPDPHLIQKASHRYLHRSLVSRLAVQALLSGLALTSFSGLLAYDWWPNMLDSSAVSEVGKTNSVINALADNHPWIGSLMLGLIALHLIAALVHQIMGHKYLEGLLWTRPASGRKAKNKEGEPGCYLTMRRKDILLLIASVLLVSLVLI